MSTQRSIRFPDEVEAKVRELAAQADRDFSYMVVRACEAYYMGKTKAGFPSAPSGVAQETPRPSKRAPSIRDTWAR